MDEPYLLACARYVELNPVRAFLAADPATWRWSSAAAHLAGRDDGLVTVRPLLERVPDWLGFLAGGLGETEHAAIRAGERSGPSPARSRSQAEGSGKIDIVSPRL